MVSGQVILVALLVGGAWFGGKAAVVETNRHVVKPVYHHVIQPVEHLFHHPKPKHPKAKKA